MDNEVIKRALPWLSRLSPVTALVTAALTIWAVHVAGFVSNIPQEFFPLLDAYFLSIFLFLFSFIVALSIFLGKILLPVLYFSYVQITSISMLIRYFGEDRKRAWVEKYGGNAIYKKLEKLARPRWKKFKFMKLLMVSSYMSGRKSYRTGLLLNNYRTFISVLSSVIFFLLFYLDFIFAVALIGLVAIGLLFIIVSIHPINEQLHGPPIEYSIQDHFTRELFSPAKWVLLLLLISFLSGTARFASLSGQRQIGVRISSQSDLVRGSIILKTSAGIVLDQNNSKGLLFIPDGQIEMILTLR